MSDYQARIAQLQKTMQEQGAKFAMFSFSNQMRYLLGWAEHGHKRLLALFVPADGEPALVVPALNAEQAESNPAGARRVIGWEDNEGWRTRVQTLLSQWEVRENDIALIDDELYSVHLLSLQELFPKLRYRPADATMALLRGIKTQEELHALTTAAELIDAVYEEAVGAIREGMTELDLVAVVLGAIKKRNTRPSFDPLICFGENCSQPHHDSGQRTLKYGDTIIMDIGCFWEGYCSDITRTLSFGTPRDPDTARVYDIVSQAHWAAREAAKPGVLCEQVDVAARKVITDAGYGEQFMHRTGHGIGLSGHEPPYIVGGDTTPLQAGMCFSIEPGIYLTGRFGVRIENIVTVTADGVRSLNAEAPRQLRVIGE